MRIEEEVVLVGEQPAEERNGRLDAFDFVFADAARAGTKMRLRNAD